MKNKSQFKKIFIISLISILLIGSVYASIYTVFIKQRVQYLFTLHPEVFENKTLEEALSLKVGDYMKFVDSIDVNDDGTYYTWTKEEIPIKYLEENCELMLTMDFLLFNKKGYAYRCDGINYEWGAIVR